MRLSLLVSATLALASTGCFFHDHHHHDDEPFGTLVVDWTVEGSKSARACRDNGVDTIDVVIRTRSGRVIDEFLERCELFEVAVDLFPGTYTVEAVLLDFDGFELTTTVTDRVPVFDFEVSVSAVDFPSDSFL